jgi:hypothetical protein
MGPLRSTVGGLVVGVSVLGLTGLGGGACTTPPPGAVTLYNGDDGRETGVVVGGTVEVRLTSPSPVTRWAAPISSNAEVLARVAASPAEGGGTIARFEARRAGTAVITVALACRTDRPAPVCRIDREPWRVTVHVSS